MTHRRRAAVVLVSATGVMGLAAGVAQASGLTSQSDHVHISFTAADAAQAGTPTPRPVTPIFTSSGGDVAVNPGNVNSGADQRNVAAAAPLVIGSLLPLAG